MYKFSSKRQKAVATRTFLEELAALRHAVEEAYALRLLLQSLVIGLITIDIYSDNESILKSAAQPKNELKRSQMTIAYHVVRKAYAVGLVKFFHVRGKENVADLLKNVRKSYTGQHAYRLL